MALRLLDLTASTQRGALFASLALAAAACTDERTGARVESPLGPDAAPPGADESRMDASPDAPGVRLVGRVDVTDPAGARFAWSGTGVIAAFEGSGVTLSLNDSGQNQFTVLIDGVLGPKLVTLAGPGDYELASDLPPGEHVVEVYRRTEPSFGVTQFLGLELGAGGALREPPEAARRIELIGDSVSTGYGNEGESPTCGFSADTQNHHATYGALAARALGAELSTIAWSGKGVVYNYDTDTVEPMPALYGRTLPAEPESSFDFSSEPDAVVINLGTNDYSTDGDPEESLFAAEYAALLGRVRAAYPAAFILCTVGPLLNGADLTAARAGIAAGVAAFEAAGGSNVRVWEMDVPNTDPGCDYHPGLATHQAMADALTAELRPLLP